MESIGNKRFKEIFDLYFNSLCSFGNKYIPDRFAVEDIVQEVFITFWDKRDGFNHLNAIKAYLYTSVRNKCFNYIKHQKVVQKKEQKMNHTLESEQGFTNHVIEEDTFNQLFYEIKNLPKASQEIMLLALNGLKNQDIADELNISINTVKTQKKIAYSKLKTQISPMLQSVLLGVLGI